MIAMDEKRATTDSDKTNRLYYYILSAMSENKILHMIMIIGAQECALTSPRHPKAHRHLPWCCAVGV